MKRFEVTFLIYVGPLEAEDKHAAIQQARDILNHEDIRDYADTEDPLDCVELDEHGDPIL